MRRFAYGGWLAVCCCLLAGCVRAYVQPAGADPSAEITLASAGNTETNSFVAFPDNPCTSNNKDPAELGTLSILAARTKQVRVWTDTRMYIKALAWAYKVGYVGGGYHEIKQRLCVNVVSFVPQRGKRYELKQEQSATSCAAVVIDLDTMQPAAGFERHPIEDACTLR
jgi:hypothetical protein